MRLNLVNLAGFQIGWFACVLGAAAGRPWIGPIVVAAIVGVHLSLVPRRLPETLLIAAAAVLGYAIDSALVLGSAIEIPGPAALGGPSPVWMVALWINFAVTLHRSLAWLVERPAIGVLFGALGGPLAYWGGARLGALVLPAPSGLLAVGLAWALAMAVLIVLAARTRDAVAARGARMSPLLLILIGWAAMIVVMGGLWLVQRATRNAGIVDIAWSFGTGLVAVWFAWGADGAPVRRVLIAAMAAIWGARLGFYLLRRVLGEAEDGRYRALRERWGDRTQIYLFAFFQVQAFWAVLFALPMLVAARNPAPAPGLLDLAGAAVWIIAIAGETIADRQLARFRRDPANRGAVCRDGLWRYSRHPNYFFEWVHWWAYVLIGIAGPYGWLTLGGPLVMLFFLFKVTGIPPTEARALESRGEAYREYQRTTSVFFPWPPKPGATT